MSQTTRKEILEKMRRRYLSAGPKYKRKLLDQVQELLGYHRKSAVRALGAPKVEPVPWINAGRPVSYEPGVLQPWLRPIWKATDYACGQRLVAMLPEWSANCQARRGTSFWRPARARWTGCSSPYECKGWGVR